SVSGCVPWSHCLLWLCQKKTPFRGETTRAGPLPAAQFVAPKGESSPREGANQVNYGSDCHSPLGSSAASTPAPPSSPVPAVSPGSSSEGSSASGPASSPASSSPGEGSSRAAPVSR